MSSTMSVGRCASGSNSRRMIRNSLKPESREHLKGINLRFHDWRRTADSRFMAGGMSAHYVKKLLGHADLKTTRRHLKIDQQGMHSVSFPIDRHPKVDCSGA